MSISENHNVVIPPMNRVTTSQPSRILHHTLMDIRIYLAMRNEGLQISWWVVHTDIAPGAWPRKYSDRAEVTSA